MEIILAQFSVELLNNGFDRKTRYLHYVFWNFGEGFTKERENSSVWALLLQNCSFFIIFPHLRTMINLIEKSKSTNIDYCSFRVSLLIFEAALFYQFCLLDFDFSYVEVSQHFGNNTYLRPILGVTFHEEIYWINSFTQNIFELLIFSAMNLLKPAILLFFENPWSKLNFFSVWL